MQKNLVVSVRRMRAIASASVKQAASCLAIFLSLGAVPAGAADTLDNPDRLIDLTLEELSNLEVISAARRPQKLREAASALYVITQQDIRRAGATSIPEALRLAPNLSVARAASNQYAISARGFNSTTANKLLVLIDGRSVYTPLFSGVFWDVQDTLMEDIDRIEVISGPGATLWGANAVNGIINVITRSAADTKGKLATAHVGSEERGAAFRFGGSMPDATSYRVYGKASNHDASVGSDGSRQQDAWRLTQGGFRLDNATAEQSFTVQGDVYSGSSEQPIFGLRTLDGANLLGRWSRRTEDGSSLQAQTYYDYTKRVHPGTFGESLNTFDLDVQHGFRLAEQHKILWGGGYRYSDDSVENTAILAFLPAHRVLRTANFFVQDQIDLIPDSLTATVGTKFEHNEYSGFDLQPSARLSWKANERDQIWAAISRAARTPSRVDTELFVPSTPPFLLAGGPNFRSETVTATKLGYRGEWPGRASLSATLFYNVYKDLRNLEINSTGALILSNRMQGETYGLELWGEYRPNSRWRLQAGYRYLQENLRLPADTTDPMGTAGAGNDPKHQFSLRSSVDLPHNVEWDTTLRHVSKLPGPPSAPLPQSLRVPAYTELDMRLAWKRDKQFELALIGQNLLHSSHLEFFTTPAPSEVERSIFMKATWKF